MNRQTGFSVLVALLLNSATLAQERIPLAEASEVFEQARGLSQADAGKLWGRPLYGPVLLVDPETRFLVANQPDGEDKLTESQGVYVGKLPETEPIANFAYRWAGIHWTMLMWPLPENPYARGRLVMHECFHRIQTDLGFAGSNPSNSHLDSPQGRSWLRLEFRALAEALIHTGERRRTATVDALIFRAYRHSLFTHAAEEERALELNEGLAEYTGYKLSGLPEAVLADRVAVRLEREEQGTRFVRSFAYASGPAWGILLDEVPVTWRGKLNPDLDLASVLAASVGFEAPENLSEEAGRRAARYNGKAVLAAEDARAELQRLTAARYRQQFVEGPVLILPLGESMRYTFDPTAAEALGDLGTVYLSARVSDEWGELEASGAVLLSRDAAGNISTARVSAPTSTGERTLEGSGWKLSLAEGWEVVAGTRSGDFTIARRK